MPASTLTHKTDQQILEKLRDPEHVEAGFRLLIDAYKERMYHHIRRMVIDHDDTDDVLQETFIKIWNNIHTFRGESGLYTWIFRITSNEALGFLKKRKRRLSVSLDNIADKQIFSNESDAFNDETQYMVRFQKALLTLPDKQRLVFNMRYFDKLKYEEMASITGSSVGALKASYHHAVKKIEKKLASH
jgi:RNA polymerase sigma-70 factor (ECF subfamily)